jgi:hypothetical protein
LKETRARLHGEAVVDFCLEGVNKVAGFTVPEFDLQGEIRRCTHDDPRASRSEASHFT